MEKFGVETDESITKEATGEDRKVCPRCGRPLLPSVESNVPRCASCGTEPFEKR